MGPARYQCTQNITRTKHCYGPRVHPIPQGQGKIVFFDAKHFFDGFYFNGDYAMQVLQAAIDGGADRLVLCDTNGGRLPLEVKEAVRDVLARYYIPVSIHCHNDGGFATANSILAIQAGATQVQGTFNGFGERCGNTDLVTIIPTLKFKLGLDCIDDDKVKNLTNVAHFIYELANLPPRDDQPYVGRNAFAHKGGIHISAVIRDSRTYEHIDPTLVGNNRNIKISELTGGSSIVYKANNLAFPSTKMTLRSTKSSTLLKKRNGRGIRTKVQMGPSNS